MTPLKRRTLLGAIGVGLAGVATLAVRPGRTGAPHERYFQDIAKALKDAGIATPTLVVDRQRLHANVGQIVHNMGGRMQLRVVAKSLPSVPLLDEILTLAKTDRLMVFSLPNSSNWQPAPPVSCWASPCRWRLRPGFTRTTIFAPSQHPSSG